MTEYSWKVYFISRIKDFTSRIPVLISPLSTHVMSLKTRSVMADVPMCLKACWTKSERSVTFLKILFFSHIHSCIIYLFSSENLSLGRKHIGSRTSSERKVFVINRIICIIYHNIYLVYLFRFSSKKDSKSFAEKWS